MVCKEKWVLGISSLKQHKYLKHVYTVELYCNNLSEV